MENIKDLIAKVLEQGYLMSLGTADESGPWVSDVIFVYDKDWNIYWISEMGTRHSKAIEKTGKAAATITVSNDPGEDNVGLQIGGTARRIEGDILEMARAHRRKRKKPELEKEGEILDEGESWYILKPTKIELIYEPLFGFDKKTFEVIS